MTVSLVIGYYGGSVDRVRMLEHGEIVNTSVFVVAFAVLILESLLDVICYASYFGCHDFGIWCLSVKLLIFIVVCVQSRVIDRSVSRCCLCCLYCLVMFFEFRW